MHLCNFFFLHRNVSSLRGEACLLGIVQTAPSAPHLESGDGMVAAGLGSWNHFRTLGGAPVTGGRVLKEADFSRTAQGF